MKFRTIKVYRCRNCGKEIIVKGMIFNSDEEESFLEKSRYEMSVSNGCYAFFHECSETKIGYCELIRREIEDKELERQKLILKTEIEDIDQIKEKGD